MKKKIVRFIMGLTFIVIFSSNSFAKEFFEGTINSKSVTSNKPYILHSDTFCPNEKQKESIMLNIKQIIDEFLENPFWEILNLKTPDQNLLNDFISNYKLPEDYIEFLSLTNGLIFFNAGDFAFNDIDWILEKKYNKKYNSGFKEEILIVGYFMGYELLIDQKESRTQNYLYAGDACTPDNYVKIGTITDFLNGFIQSKGEIPFWEINGKQKFNIMQD